MIQVSGEDDFPYGDWTAPHRTPAGRDAVLALYGGSFDLLLGRLRRLFAGNPGQWALWGFFTSYPGETPEHSLPLIDSPRLGT